LGAWRFVRRITAPIDVKNCLAGESQPDGCIILAHASAPPRSGRTRVMP
jgi:hypothetical protein